jgi:uncharacterized membrane protein
MDARAGAALSVPTAAVLFVLASPWALDLSGFSAQAALVFAAVGLVFPAAVTILTFRATALLGPTITSSVSATAPLFAIVAAWLLLDERVPAQAATSALGVVAGVALLTWRAGEARRVQLGRALLWPLAGAIVRGLAQAGVKAGLLLWPNPFAASLLSYLMSTATVASVDRLRNEPRGRRTPAGIAWFMLTGAFNGGAMLLMYSALSLAPVWKVAPIVASYPLITALMGALFLPDEKLTLRVGLGAALTVGAIAWLVGAPI